MRTKWATVVCGVLLLGLMWAPDVTGHSVTIMGSVNVALSGGGTLAPDDLVGFAVTANPGLEKTITQHLPPFTLPVFVDGERDDDNDAVTQSRRPLRVRFDTTLVLTNPKTTTIEILVTLRGADGATLGTQTVVLGPHVTVIVPLSPLVP
jgi:hypothetical protein